MPARKRNLTLDDDAGPSQSQSADQAQLTQLHSDKYSEADVNDKARNLVRFFVAAAGRKQPIKRQEINEKVMKDMPRALNIVIEKAKPIMEDVFGLRLVELEKPYKTFCVVNMIELDVNNIHLTWSDLENQQAALIMICLSIIFMSGDAVPDEVLWEALLRMGLDAGKPDNEVFGDVKKLVTQEFVQQGYLIHKKVQDTDPPKFHFTWGPRAHALTSREDVLSFVCQIYGDMEMFEWPQQYDIIHGEGAAVLAREQASQSQSQAD